MQSMIVMYKISFYKQIHKIVYINKVLEGIVGTVSTAGMYIRKESTQSDTYVEESA